MAQESACRILHLRFRFEPDETVIHDSLIALQGLYLTNGDNMTCLTPEANRTCKQEDLLSFAAWAFGGEGLRHLEVLVWVNFNPNSHSKCSPFIFARDPTSHEGFRRTGLDEIEEWTTVHDVMDFLMSCESPRPMPKF